MNPDLRLADLCELAALRRAAKAAKKRRKKRGRPRGKRRCSIARCERPHNARGLCMLHYQRWRMHPDHPPDSLPVRSAEAPQCFVPGCRRPMGRKGYCPEHFAEKYGARRR